MARAATAPELTLLRSPGQRSKLYLAIYKPPIVYSARVNQTFTAYDEVVEVTYDGGAGTLANVKPGMTMYVGTSAGAYDKGIVRIRKAPDATKLYVGECSDIEWSDNDYLTVVDDFSLWAKELTTEDNVVKMDWDVTYTDQHTNCDPVPVLGPAAAVLWLTGATVDIALDGSNSWVIGSTISAYAWSAPGASATSGMDTATPTLTFNAAGVYRVSCTVTAANGKFATGYRLVFVFDKDHLPIRNFRLDSCSGDYEEGGWNFSVTMWDEANMEDVRDRALVVLFARDWYGDTEQSIGPVAGYENVIAIGWIDKQTIGWNPGLSTVSFDVHGPQWWLAHISGYPVGVEDTTGTPNAWTEFNALSVDRGLWHFLHWRSTATLLMDIYPSNNTLRLPAAQGEVGALWEQLDSITNKTILAKPLCDRYGRLFVRVDSQYLPIADRASIPVVQAIEKQDWTGNIEFERVIASPVSMLDLSGVSWDGATGTPILSKSAGRAFKPYGTPETIDNLLLHDQTQANALAGCVLGKMNNPYPSIPIDLTSNNRLIDICPLQYITLSMAAADNPLGLIWTDRYLVPRRIEYSYNPETGVLLTSLECEARATPELATTIVPPQTPVVNIPIEIPDVPVFPIVPPPVYGPQPPITPNPPNPPNETPCKSGEDTSPNGPFDLFASTTLYNTPEYEYCIPITAFARPGDSPNPTRVEIDCQGYTLDNEGNWQPDNDTSWFGVYLRNLVTYYQGTITKTDTGVTIVFTTSPGIDFDAVCFRVGGGPPDCDYIERMTDGEHITDFTVDESGIHFSDHQDSYGINWDSNNKVFYQIVPHIGNSNNGIGIQANISLVASKAGGTGWWHAEFGRGCDPIHFYNVVADPFPTGDNFTILGTMGPWTISPDWGNCLGFYAFANPNPYYTPAEYTLTVDAVIVASHKLVITGARIYNVCQA